jgi:hypothetical protein
MIAERLVTRLLSSDATGQSHDIEADLTKCPIEQPVHLVTPAPAASMNDFLEDPLEVQIQRTAKLHVEILIRDVQEMLLMNRPETIEIRSDRALVVDAHEVVSEIHFHPASFEQARAIEAAMAP